jgi:hypothetical protein
MKVLLKNLFPRTKFLMTNYDDTLQIHIYKIWFGKLFDDIKFEVPATTFNREGYKQFLATHKVLKIR